MLSYNLGGEDNALANRIRKKYGIKPSNKVQTLSVFQESEAPRIQIKLNAYKIHSSMHWSWINPTKKRPGRALATNFLPPFFTAGFCIEDAERYIETGENVYVFFTFFYPQVLELHWDEAVKNSE